MSTGGEVANALVCKTSIRGFNSRPVLQKLMIAATGSDRSQPFVESFRHATLIYC